MKNKNKNKNNYLINEKSTRKTFDLWLSKYGNDLSDSYNVLSFSGSDGPEITNEKIGNVYFNQPEEVENFLIKEGAYEEQDVMCNEVHYIPPTVHYLGWFKQNYK